MVRRRITIDWKRKLEQRQLQAADMTDSVEAGDKRPRTHDGVDMCTEEHPNGEAWIMALEDYFTNEETEQDVSGIMMNLNGTDIAELGSDDEYDLVPEERVFGEKSGLELPLKEARAGRELEVGRMAQFGVAEDAPEQEAFGKEKVGSRWLDNWKQLPDGSMDP